MQRTNVPSTTPLLEKESDIEEDFVMVHKNKGRGGYHSNTDGAVITTSGNRVNRSTVLFYLTILGLFAVLREVALDYNHACNYESLPLSQQQQQQRGSSTSSPPKPQDSVNNHEPLLFFNYTQRGAALLRPSKQINQQSILDQHQWKHLTLLQHIPKTGGTSLYDRLTHYSRDPILVNNATRQSFQLENWYVSRVHDSSWFDQRFSRKPCDAVMVETEFFSTLWRNESNTNLGNNKDDFELATFTLIRRPAHHVVSQYFHCTESIYADHSRHMPKTLDAWLDFWIAVQQGHSLVADLARHEHPKDLFLYEPFVCYNPINMQTRFVQGLISAQALQTQFWAVGLTGRLMKSSCLFAVRLFGVVPQECNCNNQRSSTTTNHRRPRLDHNVRHHGDKYNLTQSQRDKIDALTQLDQRLYRNAVRVFEQNVQQVEQEFQVTLCG